MYIYIYIYIYTHLTLFVVLCPGPRLGVRLGQLRVRGRGDHAPLARQGQDQRRSRRGPLGRLRGAPRGIWIRIRPGDQYRRGRRAIPRGAGVPRVCRWDTDGGGGGGGVASSDREWRGAPAAAAGWGRAAGLPAGDGGQGPRVAAEGPHQPHSTDPRSPFARVEPTGARASRGRNRRNRRN